MRLPNAESLVVEPDKVRGYLLSRTHPIGMHKASFFLSLGYSTATWQHLARDLARIGQENRAEIGRHNGYGQLYVVDGRLGESVGRRALVRTVWILRDGDDRPRLVTAYPGDEDEVQATRQRRTR